MPQRTNDFQKLVYLVRVNLAQDATVTESKLLTDRHTKRKREVDVCIEGHVGGCAVVVSVECRDHKRPADVSWIDGMKAKHERLPTHVLILASRAGFTPEARAVAEVCGIQTFSLDDVDSVDFPALLEAASSLWTKTVTVSAEKVLVRVPAIASLAGETVAVMRDNLIYSADGSESFQVGLLVEALLKSPRARDYFTTEGKEDHVWFEIEWESPRDHLNRPIFLRKIEPEILREIESIQIKGPCKFQIAQFGVRRGKLGDIQVAWGKTEIFGRDAIVVATKDPAGIEKFSMNIAGKPH
jgi:hypothetical protein